jgi:uncharacterized phage protein gp47/JayE
MPYPRPTLTDQRNLAAADVLAQLGPDDVLLDWDPLLILPWSQAGLSELHFGYLDWIARQAVPFTATGEFLEAWAALVGVLRKDASFAGNPAAQFSGTPTTPVPVGTALQRQADGAQFVTTAAVTIGGGGTITAPIVALVAGAAGNGAAGSALVLANPIAGISSNVTVASAITGGADQELDDALRTRMLYAYAHPSQGGDQSDYVTWATAVAGVTRAWCVPNGQGPGTVVVYVMLDDAEAAFGGFPQGSNGVAAAEPRDAAATGDQLSVANAVFARQPVTALVYVCAPTAAPVNFTVNDISPSNAAMQAAISAALADAFRTGAAPDGTVVYPSLFTGALDAVPGLLHYTLAAPAGPIRPAVGVMPTLGTVAYGVSP